MSFSIRWCLGSMFIFQGVYVWISLMFLVSVLATIIQIPNEIWYIITLQYPGGYHQNTHYWKISRLINSSSPTFTWKCSLNDRSQVDWYKPLLSAVTCSMNFWKWRSLKSLLSALKWRPQKWAQKKRSWLEEPGYWFFRNLRDPSNKKKMSCLRSPDFSEHHQLKTIILVLLNDWTPPSSWTMFVMFIQGDIANLA